MQLHDSEKVKLCLCIINGRKVFFDLLFRLLSGRRSQHLMNSIRGTDSGTRQKASLSTRRISVIFGARQGEVHTNRVSLAFSGQLAEVAAF
jgi:hypothetical protein